MSTPRIRWHDETDGATGHVGTLNPRAFRIDRLPDDSEWLLTCALTGQEAECRYGDTPGELKQAAEEWLAEFAAYLGASFADEPVTAPDHMQGPTMETLTRDEHAERHGWKGLT